MSFIRFLDARNKPGESLYRLKFLKKLSLDLCPPTEAASRTLESLFKRIAQAASNFTSLEISEAEALLSTYPPLCPAIAKLTTLKNLDLRWTGAHCATLLLMLQSSLTTATIYFGVPGRELEFDFIPANIDMNPMILLEGSKSSLESLSTSYAVSSLDGPCPYNSLTRLDLSYIDLPFVEDYIRAFPNLHSLTASQCTGSSDAYDIAYWNERRETALLYQAQHGTWRSLQHCQASMLLLWTWGLTCHIPSVRLSFEHELGVCPNFLKDVILDVRPSELALRLPGTSWLLNNAVRAVLSEEGHLQVLDMCILFYGHQSNDTVSVGHILDLLVNVVRASSVSAFKLILDLTTTGELHRRRSGEGLPMTSEVYLQDMDVDDYADVLFASATSLKEIPISILNINILFHIMGCSTRKTLLRMMLTCRDLHRGGIKHLLRKTPSICNERKLKSFLSFCEARGEGAEVAYRMHYLRGLEINLETDDMESIDSSDSDEVEDKLGSTARAFTHLITSTIRLYAHNFTRLLLLSGDSLLVADPNLPLAIASLTTLTYLNIGDATERSFGLLGSLQSRLVEAHIGMNIDLIDPPDGDLTAFLRRSESSLTILSLYHTSHPSGVACYSQLHTLDIRHLEIPTTRHYVTTFPNLRVLTANECIGHSGEEEEWVQFRDLNTAQQAQEGSWSSLQSYVGSILFLYLFGLACHVPYVHVDAEDEYESMIIQQVRAVVADTRPEHLVIDVSQVSHVLDQAEDIIALFKDSAFQAVKTFVLDLCLCAGDHKTDMEAMLECIFTAVSSNSSLVGFGLVIKWSALRWRMWNTTTPVGPSGKKQRPKPSRAQAFLDSLDVHSVADRLLGSCQSLRAVKVVLGKATSNRGPVDIILRKKTSGPRAG
ncbi:hypothetical protein V8D89_007683 [Ganoderma adspersum]